MATDGWMQEAARLADEFAVQLDANGRVVEENDRLRRALNRTLVTLIAATSLLVKAEDEKKQPSKVVASDKMFMQILKDHDAATAEARAALTTNAAEALTAAEFAKCLAVPEDEDNPLHDAALTPKR